MNKITLSDHQVTIVLVALDTLRDHYAKMPGFLAETAHQGFKETAENVRAQVPTAK